MSDVTYASRVWWKPRLLCVWVSVLPVVDSTTCRVWWWRTTASVLTLLFLVGTGTQALVLQGHVSQLVHVHIPANWVSRRHYRCTTCEI